MRVTANDEPVDLPEPATVADLLNALGLDRRWVVVEHNGEPVPRARSRDDSAGRRGQDRIGAGGRGRVIASIADRRLYLCTADRPDLAPFLEACIAGGVDVVQLRDKLLDARPLLQRARLAALVCHDGGVPFILNDRPDLALEVGADGVHLGQDDAPPKLARRILGPGALVGLSTHAPAELDAATREPVDYVSAGPVERTPTKPGRAGTGLEYLQYAATTSRRPWFVTGGVRPDVVRGLVNAGARRFVVVRWLTEAPDARHAAVALRGAIDDALADLR